jgi:putative ABC transport system substrate-binding protein
MDRRGFVFATGSALCALAAPGASYAQDQARRYRIGYLSPVPLDASARQLQALRDGLRELGYLEGRNLDIDYRTTRDDFAALSGQAAELVALKPDLLIAWTTPAVTAARATAPASMPIVMVGVTDPVGSGLVASLARPGGNVTGTTNISADLGSKLVELLAQVVPKLKRVACVRNSLNSSSRLQVAQMEAAAGKMGIEFRLFELSAAAELEGIFAAMTRARMMGAAFVADPLWLSQRERIAGLALKHRLPAGFARVENVEAGGLLAYGPTLVAQFRRTAYFADRIFKGAAPADLPVELPATLELVVNLKTAKALELKIPDSIRLRADRVIE